MHLPTRLTTALLLLSGVAYAGASDTGLLATAKALTHAFAVLKEKGSSDTLAGELYSFDKLCRLVGFEHVWNFEKRWQEE